MYGLYLRACVLVRILQPVPFRTPSRNRTGCQRETSPTHTHSERSKALRRMQIGPQDTLT